MSLGPKFVVAPKKLPDMEIIENTEKTCLSLERIGKKAEAETLRFEVSKIVLTAPPPPPNLTSKQKKGLSYLKKNRDKIAVVPFDKGQGLATMDREELVKKSEKEFKNVTLDTKDTTQTHQGRLQRQLREYHKDGKLDDDTFKAVYPSSSVTPTANPAVKAHKPEKQFPIRLITSHIGAPQENLASYINDIHKPFIENNEYVCKNSFDFVERMKKVKLGPNEKQASLDASALFPSVPVSEANEHIRTLLQNDPTLPARTKLLPPDICNLISLCLSTSNFIYDDRHHTQNDSGPIGLSLMVTISQIWMIFTMQRGIEIARDRGTPVPRHITIYMDDIYCIVHYGREGLRSNTASDPLVAFNDCLNAVHPRVQFTREIEENGSIAFLDVFLTRQTNGKLNTKVYRKPSNTNITIKPHSCQHPLTAISNFKSELCRAHRLCSTKEDLDKEIKFIINMFQDNGHNRNKLEKIAKEYTPPTIKRKDGHSKKQNNRQNKNNHTKEIPENLFDVLPLRTPQLVMRRLTNPMLACLSYLVLPDTA